MKVVDFRMESLSKYRNPVSRQWFLAQRTARRCGSFHGGNMEIEGAASSHDGAEQIEQ